MIIDTVLNVGPEHDAKPHTWLRPDPAYAGLLNAANVCCTPSAAALLLEIVPACSGQPAAPSTAAACPPNPMARPHLRAHIRAWGAGVLDTRHGWRELHPLDGSTPRACQPRFAF